MIDNVYKMKSKKYEYVFFPFYLHSQKRFVITLIIYMKDKVLSMNYEFESKKDFDKQLDVMKDLNVRQQMIVDVEKQLSNPEALPNELRQTRNISKN